MHAVDGAVAVVWVAFWVYWLVSAAGVKAGRPRLGLSVAPRVVIALLVFLAFRVRLFHGQATRSPWVAALGFALVVLGLGLAVWARVNLGRNWGTPMSEKDEPELVTTGPYRWIRNPIYSGLILAMVGTAIAVSVQWLVVAAAVGGFFVYSAYVEQRFLATRFPESYPSYQRSTKMLVPFLF
jgi:protein-S-isoprenylcysteine O-methyltransferase Ste14